MPHGRNMPLDLRDVGPDYTGPLRLNDIVLIPEQEEKLRIKVDKEKGRDTVEPSPEFEAILSLPSHWGGSRCFGPAVWSSRTAALISL